MKNKNFFRKNSSGQVIIEYVLLLVISVSIAALVIRQLGSRDPNEPGLIIVKWQQVLQAVAKDLPDKCEGSCN
ncbi:MAG: hypothetical protein AABY64_11820 [Bdellovibrionota bacterium]